MNNRAFVICTAPRTGSNLLSDTLSRAGDMGRPKEYFDIHEHIRAFWREELNMQGDQEYLDKVIAAGTTPNGVFAVKLHWHQSPALIDAFVKAGAIEPDMRAGATVDACLRQRFNSVRYVWLRRRNKVAQGISYYRAVQTESWWQEPNARSRAVRNDRIVPFDLASIERFVGLVERFDVEWGNYFKRVRAPVMVLVYEDLVKTYEHTLREVKRFVLGGEADLAAAPRAFEQQADDISREWEDRFRRIKRL